MKLALRSLSKTLIFSCTAMVCSLSLSLAAQTEVKDVLGKWVFRADVGNGMSFAVHMNVKPNEITVTNECTSNNQTAQASVTVPATITDKQIILQGSAQQSVTTPVACSIDSAPGIIDYVVNGNQMTMTSQGQTITVQREP